MKVSCRRQEQREYGLIDNASQCATQLREQGPTSVLVFRIICEYMGFVKSEDNKGPPWPLARVQCSVGIYKVAEFFSRLCNPCPILFVNVAFRAVVTEPLDFYTPLCQLKKICHPQNNGEGHGNLPCQRTQLLVQRNVAGRDYEDQIRHLWSFLHGTWMPTIVAAFGPVIDLRVELA